VPSSYPLSTQLVEHLGWRLLGVLCKLKSVLLYTKGLPGASVDAKKMDPFVPQTLPVDIDWQPLIPLMGPANRALAHFDGVLYGLPNPEVLMSPLTTQEAVLSSRIEGTQATLGEVFRFEAGEAPGEESRRLDIQEILNYRVALHRAERELKTRPFNLNLLLELHNILLDSVRGRNKERGQFRRVQNWIGRAGCKIEEAEFVPPDPAQLPPCLDNLEKYYHTDSPDLLVQLAIVHAQFEVIHPFLDGNGRLGRILIPLFLFERKLLTQPVFYLSSYLEQHRDEYIERLRGLSQLNGWNPWIEFFLKAIAEQAETNMKIARSMMDLYERLKAEVIGLTHSQYAVPLLDVLFEHPIFSSSTLEDRPGLPSKQMIMTLLGKLKDAGILIVLRESRGRRAQILGFPELLNLCEARDVLPSRHLQVRPEA
jgi:Fic family protein